MITHAEMATRERSLAKAAAERAQQARLDAANAAFQDTADVLTRQAEEEDRAARAHLEAAREYERLANEAAPSASTVGVDEETSLDAGHEAPSGFARWRRHRRAAEDAGDDLVPPDTTTAPPAAAEHDQRIRFFEYSRDLMCTAGFDGYFKLLNEAWERTLGYSRDELLKRPYLDFVHPADLERTSAEAASLATAGVDTVHFRNRYRAEDGSYRWLEWSARSDTETELIYAIARDVTEQQRAAEVESRLGAIVRSSNDGIYGVSAEGMVTSWNLGAERLYGYSAREIVGQPLSRLIPPEHADWDRALLGRVLAGETVEHVETTRVRKDGSFFEASVSVSPILDADGRITGASVSARDISKNKEADQRFRAAFDDAPIGMALLSADGKCVEVNLALLEATGHTRGTVIEAPFDALLEPSSKQSYHDHVKQAFSGGLRTFRIDATLTRSAGPSMPALLNVSVIRDHLGQPTHFVCHVLTQPG